MVYDPGKRAFAKELRQRMTRAEVHLWKHALRAGMLKGYGFHRQYPVAGYVADFYCSEFSLVIEVDGGIHGIPEQAQHDLVRTKKLEGLGLSVVRFTNERVLFELEQVREELLVLVDRIEKEAGDRSRAIWQDRR